MSSRLSIIFLVTILFGLPYLGVAQEGRSLKLISYRDEGRVLLRWAPTSAVNWQEWNDNGYSLVRYTITRDSVRVFPPELITLGNSIRPAILEDWEKSAIDNKYAGIAAQAIYGDSFIASTASDKNNVLQLIQLSKEQEMRYSFTILSADQSFEVAQLAGLGFEDKKVNEDETYVYKLFGNNGLEASDTVYNYVDLYDHAPLPKVEEIEADFRDRIVSLSWRSNYYIDTYTSYLVEKSTDGKNFIQLDDLGTITTSQDRSEEITWMMKSDSLADNSTIYYYRIRGRTPFGIIGPPSEVVVGSGRKKFDLSMGIIKATDTQEGVNIKWSVEGKSVEQVDKILVERSTNSIDYMLLDSLPANAQNYRDIFPKFSNYYKLTAISSRGEQVSSLPYFVQIQDSIPPSIPTGLLGIADTTGRVTLNWSGNKEQDLEGYRVFRSRIPDGVYRQVTSNANRDTIYQDNVSLQSLSKNIYYKISAVDSRGNASELSTKALVELPDLIAPVPPRITEYSIDDQSIKLTWTNSSSLDVVKTKIYKKTVDSLISLGTIKRNDSITHFVDSTDHSGLASYYLVAIDESGNESYKSNIIVVESPINNNDATVELQVKADRRDKTIKLSWNSANEADEFRIYKAKGEESISLYKVIEGNINQFNDDQLEVNSAYHYRVQLLNLAKKKILFSDQVDIVY